MEVGSTEASSSSQGGTGWLDLTLVTCTETVTFTEVVAEEEWGSFYYSFKTEQLVTLWILFVVTIAGNAIVLFSTWRRKRKSRMTFFVTQLAITDSFTGLINIMTDIIWRYTGDFMAPDIVCRVVRYFQVVLLYASTYVLVSLSIDRYHAIVYPMKFLQGERQAKVLIGVAWSLSFLFSIPTLIIFGKRQLSNGEVQCWALWPDDSYWIPYMTVVAFLVYFIPLIIIREGCFSPISPEACPLVQSFMCHNRTFILDGHVQLKTGLQTQERHLFLFTDLLVVAKSKSHSHFKLKCQARLCEMWTAFCTEEVCEGSTDPERSFVLGWPTTNCVANFRSAEQKETWLSFLQSRIREEKEKDYPKSIPLKIIAKDVGTCAYSKTLSVTNVDTANDVILMALQQLGVNGSEKDYKLWVISGREDAPYPLIGHEYPFGIKMSHIRDAMPHGSKHCACPRQLQGSFLTEQLPQELQCQFVLKPSRLAVCPQLNDLSQKSFKRKRSIINWAFWRGPGTHLDNAPLSSTSAAPGKLFGLLLTAICEDDNLPKPLLDMLSLLYQEGPSTEGIFRRSGSAKTCKELKEKLDSGAEVDLACESIFVTASLFKDFLRNIPGSILSSQLCDKWVSVMDQGNNEEKIKSIQRLIEQLPRANVVLLRYIFGVLHGIEMRSEENQMNAFNLAICIAPSLLWPPVSSTPDIESEFTKKISSLVQFLTENCCRIFGEEITSLFGEILMTCKRENSSDAASLHLNDSSYDSLENEANDEADSSSSDWIKNRDQDNRSRESVFTLSDGDSEQTEVDEIQSKTKSKQLTISVDVHRKFSSQENSENESLCSNALGFSSAATSGALKTLRRHRRSSEPAIGILAPSFTCIGSGHEKATRKASCDVVLSHEDEDYLHQLRSLQMEGQKLINQSLIIGINVGKNDITNQNVEKKDLSHCLLPPTPEGLNICSGFSSSSLSSPGTSPSVSSMSSLDSAFSQFSDQSVFTPTETSSPFDSTFQLLQKQEGTAAEVADDYLVTSTKVPPSPQPTDALAEAGLVEPNSRPAPLKPTDGVDSYLIKPDIQQLPLKVAGRDRLHDPRSKRRSRRGLQQSKV